MEPETIARCSDLIGANIDLQARYQDVLIADPNPAAKIRKIKKLHEAGERFRRALDGLNPDDWFALPIVWKQFEENPTALDTLVRDA